MKKKKVLIVSYSYPPANVPAAQRPYSIAKYLDKDKFEVTVLTCGNQDSSLGFDSNFIEELEYVKLLKINGYKVSKNRKIINENSKQKTSLVNFVKQKLIVFISFFIYPDKAVFWYPKVKKYIHQNKDNLNFDIIFSTSPMFTNHMVGNLVKKINPKAKFVTDFRDFHYIENTQRKKGYKALLDKFFEKKIISNSHQVCFISNSMKKIYSYHYPNFSGKFKVIYNGYDPEEYQFKEEIKLPEKLSIFYAGSFYKGIRNPMPLLMTLEKLIEEKELKTSEIQIEIAGNFEEELVENIKSLKIFQSIKFLGLLPRNKVLKKYRSSHLLWLIVGNKVTHYAGVPIKFYEYLASGRPIINFAPEKSEPSKLIQDLNLGWNFNSEDNFSPKHIDIFKEILLKHRKAELNRGLALNKIDKFTRQKQTQILEKIFLS